MRPGEVYDRSDPVGAWRADAAPCISYRVAASFLPVRHGEALDTVVSSVESNIAAGEMTGSSSGTLPW